MNRYLFLSGLTVLAVGIAVIIFVILTPGSPR